MKTMISGKDFRALLELVPPFTYMSFWLDNYMIWKEEVKASGLVSNNDIFPSTAIMGTYVKFFRK